MKNIELLELEGKIKNPIMEFLLEHDDYLAKEQIDAILSRGESGLEDLRLILKAYNQHHLKYLEIEDYGNVYCMSSVILALVYLNDEQSFDDMISYLYSSPELIVATWDDGFYESFPLCFAKFPDKLDKIKEVLYDPNLITDMKEILSMGLYCMPKVLGNPSLKPVIANIFLDYLQFILIPENRSAQENYYEEWKTIEDLFDSIIFGYMDCGGDGNHPSVQRAVNEQLISEDVFSNDDLQHWKEDKFEYWDIYKFHETLKLYYEDSEDYSEEIKNLEKEQEELKKKNQILTQLLNTTKQFRNLFDRNDKVSVKYKTDGNILKDIKYKKVEDDLISGKCELI
jgi:hypothetical protein